MDDLGKLQKYYSCNSSVDAVTLSIAVVARMKHHVFLRQRIWKKLKKNQREI